MESAASNVWILEDWIVDNDSGGGDGNQYAPEGFDPFSWACVGMLLLTTLVPKCLVRRI